MSFGNDRSAALPKPIYEESQPQPDLFGIIIEMGTYLFLELLWRHKLEFKHVHSLPRIRWRSVVLKLAKKQL